MLIQKKLTPDAEEAQVPARRHLPRARERQLRRLPARLEGPRLDQRDRRLHRASASGSSTRPSPSAAASASRRAGSASPAAATACCARSTRRPARCCGRSRPDGRSPPGRRSSRADGKEYIAITVGGTPTSSGGGLASQLQVFALGGSKAESPKPPGLSAVRAASREPAADGCAGAHAGGRHAFARARSCDGAAAGGARIAIPGGRSRSALWNPNSSNLVPVTGKVLLGGKPVSGAAVVGRPLRAARARPPPTGASRRSSTRRSPAATRSRSSTGASAQGRWARAHRRPRRRRSGARRAASTSAISIDGFGRASASGNGTSVTGRAVRADGVPVPPVVLLSYRLAGTITDAAGKPVPGAYVVIADERPRLLDVLGADRTRGAVRLVLPRLRPDRGRPGRVRGPGRRRAHELHDGRPQSDVQAPQQRRTRPQAPGSGIAMAVPTSTAEPGAIYRGALVGVSGPNGVVRPISATWPDGPAGSSSCCRRPFAARRCASGRATSSLLADAAVPGGAST